eukprot:TRINITY_DN4395_c0_g1_i1.p1 TRINITY_DN4395_c0_g1~~TRINITY_DN4395_c0_g1_i1.p1  ORF type:complete len:161 (-),score=9.84 TRINITY_DN4395_c0_g1_i1:89-571(-)
MPPKRKVAAEPDAEAPTIAKSAKRSKRGKKREIAAKAEPDPSTLGYPDSVKKIKKSDEPFLEGHCGPNKREFSLEIAPSARSACSGCMEPIPMGSVRAKVRFWGADHPYSYNMHLACMHGMPTHHLPKTLCDDPTQIDGFSALSAQNQQVVVRLLNSVDW